MMQRTMQNKIISITIAAVVIAVGLYMIISQRFDGGNVSPAPDTTQVQNTGNTAPLATTSVPVVAVGTSTYYIKEMGVEFVVPQSATTSYRIFDGSTGKHLTGAILFPNGNKIWFDGDTMDFGWPKDGGITYTYGYTKSGGAYYFNHQIKDAALLPVERTITIDKGRLEAIIIIDPDTVGLGGITALINTSSALFPGIAFSGSAKTGEERATFEAIVASVTLD